MSAKYSHFERFTFNEDKGKIVFTRISLQVKRVGVEL